MRTPDVRSAPSLALLLALGACAGPAPAPCENVNLAAAPSASPALSANAGGPREKKSEPSLEVVPLSRATRRLVSSVLTDEVRIDAYVSQGFAPPAFVDALKATLDQYQAATFEDGAARSKSRARCEVHTVLNDAVDRRAAIERGLSERALVTDDPDRVDLRRGFIGIEVTYKGARAPIPWWPPDDLRTLEYFIDTKIREVQAIADDAVTTIGVASHGEQSPLAEASLYPRQPAASLQSIVKQYTPFYRLEDIDLSREAANPEWRALLVVQRDAAFSDAELAEIDRYLTVGGRTLIVVASAARTATRDRQMRPIAGASGLEGLLSAYGVDLVEKIVVDPERAYALAVIGDDGRDATLRHPLIPVLGPTDIAPSFEPWRGLTDLPFPFASPLALHPEKQPGAKLTVVAHTSRSTTVAAPTAHGFRIEEANQWTPEGTAAEQPIAVLVEGKIKSAFDATKASSSSSRLLVVSSSAFFANPFARAGDPPPVPPQMEMMGGRPGDEKLQAIATPYSQKYAKVAIASLLNLLDWASDNGDFAELMTKLVATRD